MFMRKFISILAFAVLAGACTPRVEPGTPPTTVAYERIEYLSDHLAIGITGGTAYLLRPDGTVVATDEDEERLRAGAEAAWARFLDEEYTGWEQLLDQYDSLCNACIAHRPADELLGRLERLKTQLQRTVGRMDPQQQARFADIRERYEKYRK